MSVYHIIAKCGHIGYKDNANESNESSLSDCRVQLILCKGKQKSRNQRCVKDICTKGSYANIAVYIVVGMQILGDVSHISFFSMPHGVRWDTALTTMQSQRIEFLGLIEKGKLARIC